MSELHTGVGGNYFKLTQLVNIYNILYNAIYYKYYSTIIQGM